MAAAAEAIADAGWSPDGDEAREHAGVIVGSGVGALKSLADAASTLEKDGPRRVSPQFVRSMCINLAAGYISILHGLKGPNRAVATSCSAGAHAIGDAARLIRHGDADVMVAGGAEAAVCRLGLAGFAAAGALSTRYNARPGKASRPWDRDRDGLVMGEGADVVVLEELAHARRRGARIYAELAGYGLSGDAHHVTAPSEFGHGECRAIRAALNDARKTPEAVDCINANSASTRIGDEVEMGVVKRLFGAADGAVAMSSTKSSTGHLLGAAGAVEAIFSVLAIADGVVPPTLNLDNPPRCRGIDLVPHVARERAVRVALSNSFGFGGTNAALLFAACDGALRY